MIGEVKNVFHRWLLVLGMLLSFHAVAQSSQMLDYVVAVVNDEVIVYTELQEQVRQTRARLTTQNISLPSDAEFERQVLENMIIMRLQLQLAQRNGVEVDDSTLNEALRNLAKQDQLSLEGFREQKEREGISFVKFRESVRDELLVRRLQQRQVVSRINITDKEIDNFLSNQLQQGGINAEYHLYHILIATPEAASPEEIAEKQAKAEDVLARLKAGANFQEIAIGVSDSQKVTETGGDLGWLAPARMPSFFLESLAKLEVGQVSDLLRNSGGFHIIKLVDVRGGKQVVTQTKARHILIKNSELVSDFEAKRRLTELRYRVLNGEDFAELASASSEDLGSAATGGDLGWVTPGEMVAEFEEVMDSLSEGEVSMPFKSRFGWHIISVEQRREHDNTEQARRTDAARQIRERKIDEELNTWVRQLRDEAYVEYRLDRESIL